LYVKDIFEGERASERARKTETEQAREAAEGRRNGGKESAHRNMVALFTITRSPLIAERHPPSLRLALNICPSLGFARGAHPPRRGTPRRRRSARPWPGPTATARPAAKAAAETRRWRCLRRRLSSLSAAASTSSSARRCRGRRRRRRRPWRRRRAGAGACGRRRRRGGRGCRPRGPGPRR
jgi:hypothetical protein